MCGNCLGSYYVYEYNYRTKKEVPNGIALLSLSSGIDHHIELRVPMVPATGLGARCTLQSVPAVERVDVGLYDGHYRLSLLLHLEERPSSLLPRDDEKNKSPPGGQPSKDPSTDLDEARLF